MTPRGDGYTVGTNFFLWAFFRGVRYIETYSTNLKIRRFDK